MRPTHLLGLLLWRGGLLLVGAFVVVEVARRVVMFLDVPGPVELGLALLLAGLALVFASVVAEQIRDSRAAGDLRQ